MVLLSGLATSKFGIRDLTVPKALGVTTSLLVGSPETITANINADGKCDV